MRRCAVSRIQGGVALWSWYMSAGYEEDKEDDERDVECAACGDEPVFAEDEYLLCPFA